jgi:hypothetical protein
MSKRMSKSESNDDLLQMLDSEIVDERITAIQVLGEIGEEDELHVLRERLKSVNQEMAALIVAVGKLKRRLGVT